MLDITIPESSVPWICSNLQILWAQETVFLVKVTRKTMLERDFNLVDSDIERKDIT